MWKTSFVGVLLGATLIAQSAPTLAQVPAQQAVQWQIDVMRDGQMVDSFSATTTVGQARTDTHHHPVTHDVGCKNEPAGSIDLSRTLTVSPLNADPNHVTLAIEAQETLEDDSHPITIEGCKLPPQPRQVSASHPGMVLNGDEWNSWTIVDKNPQLVYRVRAHLVSQP
ncbi:hypothetical protein [Paraburkholderia phosphatilytica]|uniref:hypothetical protein n=1 Tax=Paraburkholderia phosphatilytica TaxID=2282883 RepID=UPI000E54AB0B|nr:hypothetical protein [Paraburkholderia phosphatilytica]